MYFLSAIKNREEEVKRTSEQNKVSLYLRNGEDKERQRITKKVGMLRGRLKIFQEEE